MSIRKAVCDLFSSRSKYPKNFEKALEIVLEYEGGYVNHPDDPGGPTNMGITQKVYEDWTGREATIETMQNVTIDDVVNIYYEKYWLKVSAPDMPEGCNLSVFDFAVNAGPRQAIKTAQRVLGVKVDGLYGPNTSRAMRMYDVNKFIGQYADERLHYYHSLSTFDTFGRGWSKRVRDIADKSIEFRKMIYHQ